MTATALQLEEETLRLVRSAPVDRDEPVVVVNSTAYCTAYLYYVVRTMVDTARRIHHKDAHWLPPEQVQVKFLQEPRPRGLGKQSQARAVYVRYQRNTNGGVGGVRMFLPTPMGAEWLAFHTPTRFLVDQDLTAVPLTTEAVTRALGKPVSRLLRVRTDLGHQTLPHLGYDVDALHRGDDLRVVHGKVFRDFVPLRGWWSFPPLQHREQYGGTSRP